MATVHLVSRMPQAECVRVLKERVRPWWGWAQDAPRGRVGENWATLRMPIWYRNSFQTYLRMKMSPNPAGGTDLTCKFGISRFALVFMTIWIGFALLTSAAMLWQIASGHPQGSLGVALFSAFAFPLFGILLVGFGRYLARNEQTNLLLFLEETLNARLTG